MREVLSGDFLPHVRASLIDADIEFATEMIDGGYALPATLITPQESPESSMGGMGESPVGGPVSGPVQSPASTEQSGRHSAQSGEFKEYSLSTCTFFYSTSVLKSNSSSIIL